MNLSYTNIVSPIDGVVISRSVDVGQTVAASLSAPTLFTIAQDLTQDAGRHQRGRGRRRPAQVGMKTYFTVDSFPGQRFLGKIRQIRNAATTVQNVVTYDAVIDVDNSDLKLRPGMTANVTVVYAERDGRPRRPQRRASLPTARRARRGCRGARATRATARHRGRSSSSPASGRRGAKRERSGCCAGADAAVPSRVHTGLTDGTVDRGHRRRFARGRRVVIDTIGRRLAPADGPGGGAACGASSQAAC